MDRPPAGPAGTVRNLYRLFRLKELNGGSGFPTPPQFWRSDRRQFG